MMHARFSGTAAEAVRDHSGSNQTDRVTLSFERVLFTLGAAACDPTSYEQKVAQVDVWAQLSNFGRATRRPLLPLPTPCTEIEAEPHKRLYDTVVRARVSAAGAKG
jgi:hypothetical protein